MILVNVLTLNVLTLKMNPLMLNVLALNVHVSGFGRVEIKGADFKHVGAEPVDAELFLTLNTLTLDVLPLRYKRADVGRFDV